MRTSKLGALPTILYFGTTMEKILTPQALWSDFNPDAEQLEINVVDTFETADVIVRRLYFTGRNFQSGNKTRVFATLCTKKTGVSKRGMIVVDDYKKPLNLDELVYWTKKGFSTIGIDYAGRCQTGFCTIYPKELTYCNALDAKDVFHIEDSAKNTKLYQYALNTMRAISVLKEFVATTTISVLTVGKGSLVGNIVLGQDKRVTNGIVVFGDLYLDYAYERSFSVDKVNSEELKSHLLSDEKKQMWVAGLSPQSNVVNISVPIYAICSGNSHYVRVQDTCHTFTRIENKQSRILILPRVLDYLPEEYCKCIVRWCKGEQVENDIAISSDDGGNTIKVKTEIPQEKLSLWYCRNIGANTNHWVSAKLSAGDGCYVATPKHFQKNGSLSVFVMAETPVAMCTPIVEIAVENAQKVGIANSILYSNGMEERFVSAFRDASWHGDFAPVVAKKGYLDIVGAQGTQFITFALHDSCLKYTKPITATFDVCCDTKQQLLLTVVCGFGTDNVSYQQAVELDGLGKWQRITVDFTNFRRVSDGRLISPDSQVDLLGFHAQSKFIINNIFLV